MNEEQKEPQKTGLTIKQLAMVAGLVVVFIGGMVGVYLMMFRGEPDVASEEEHASQQEVDEPVVEELSSLPDAPPTDDPYVDERDTLSETRLNDLLDMALDFAYEGEWLELVNLVEPNDLDYNLEESEAGQYLRDLYLDANTLVTLTSLGDTPDAVDRSVEVLPTLHTEELFVLGLYYLPRNVLLEMSRDHLALAPTQRGHVQLTERVDMPFTNPDGTGNDLSSKDDKIASYLETTRINEFEEGFVRFSVQNGPIEEYVYVIQQPGDEKNLMGFYSDDTNPANTTKTVSHHLDFREDVSKGIEALLNEAQAEYEEEQVEAGEE